LGFQLGLIGGDVLIKGVGWRSAALHDTTSCLRVQTVEFAESEFNMPSTDSLFPCEQSKSGPCELPALCIPSGGKRRWGGSSQCVWINLRRAKGRDENRRAR
jgi:hypothetical protein